MKCSRCGTGEAERGEMRFESNAIVVVYLCEECAASVVRDDEVADLVRSTGQ